ncbi:GntR family transcriptional regulator [Embleya sp. NPDC055664]
MPSIDRDSPVPPSQQIAAALTRAMDTPGAEWPADRRIPSENELMEQWGVTRRTAHKAVETLIESGRAYRVKGMGTYVMRDQGAEVNPSE